MVQATRSSTFDKCCARDYARSSREFMKTRKACLDVVELRIIRASGGEGAYRPGLLMKALSGRVRILKNSKLKLRVGLKKRDAMTSDSSKDKTEVFLSGVVEGNRRS